MINAAIIAFVVGALAGVAFAWPYARREGFKVGFQFAVRSFAHAKKVKSVEAAVRGT